MDKQQWQRVNRRRPCVVCGKPDWCTYTAEGACCMRVESGRAMGNGGWFHSHGQRTPPPPIRHIEQEEKPAVDCARLLSRWSDVRVPLLAESIGVRAEALQALGCRYAPDFRAWAFPMSDASGNVVGIRLRNDAGKKWAVRGSRQGLFIPSSVPLETALICEGPTDTAAALTLGFWAVGRPSCSGGATEIKALFARLGIRRAIIVGDHDGPGQAGAEKLGKDLALPNKVWTPPAKDLRAFVSGGGRWAMIEADLKGLRWQQ